jgi:hypothetical protein
MFAQIFSKKIYKSYECFLADYMNQGILIERERISTIDLLALTSLNQLLFSEVIYSFFTEQPILMRKSTVLSLPLQ